MAIHKTVQQIKAYIFLQKWNDILLQNATDIITKCDNYFIAKCDDFITKCNTYYKCVCTISMTLDYLRKTLKYPGILFGRSQPFRCHNRGLSVKAGMGNRGPEWGEWWECGKAGREWWECGESGWEWGESAEESLYRSGIVEL